MKLHEHSNRTIFFEKVFFICALGECLLANAQVQENLVIVFRNQD